MPESKHSELYNKVQTSIPFRLDGKVALVTQGASVVVNDSHQGRAENAAAQLRMDLCASGSAKAAAIGFVRNLSADVGPHGVTANAQSLCAMNN